MVLSVCACDRVVGSWKQMEVAVKKVLFQNADVAAVAAGVDVLKEGGKMDRRQMALREAAVSCSVTHPNVVATYHYEVWHTRKLRAGGQGAVA